MMNRRKFAFSFRNALLAASLLLLAGPAAAQPATDQAAAPSQVPMPGLYRHLQARCVDILKGGRLDGSGCIIEPTGIVLTAAHVIGAPGDKLQVQFSDRKRLPVTVVAVDFGHDLALLQLPEREGGYEALKLAEAWPEPATAAYLFGNPFFRRQVLMRGFVARELPTYEYISSGKKKFFIEALHLSAMTPPGVSGGPWVNGQGEVIGVQSSAMTINKSPQGLASAGPLKSIRKLLAEKKHAETTSLDLAIEEIFSQERGFIDALAPGAAGVICVQVQKNGVGGTAGIADRNIIGEIDGRKVDAVDAFLDYIRTKKPGERVKLKVYDNRFSNPRDIEVPLSHLESDWAKHAATTETTNSP